MKPELHLAQPTLEDAIALYEKVTGRKATPEEIEECKRILAEDDQ